MALPDDERANRLRIYGLMGEIVVFPEGSAQFATGNGAFVTMAYVRNVRLRMPRQYAAAYRPPYSEAYTHVDYQSKVGTFSMTVAEGPDTHTLKALLTQTPPGSVHFHVFGQVGVAAALGSAGFYGYSGRFEAADFAGADGDGEQQFSIEGWVESWSGY